MLKLARPEILKIEPYKPGTSKLPGKAEVIKLSSNENALGISPKVVSALRDIEPRLFRYPDGACKALRQKLGETYGLNPEQLVCGVGSDELIGLLCHAYAGVGDEVLYSQHGFLMYPIYTLRMGATPVKAPEKNLTTDVESLLAAVTPRTRIVFLANPNNPTGSYVSKEKIAYLRKKLPQDILRRYAIGFVNLKDFFANYI